MTTGYLLVIQAYQGLYTFMETQPAVYRCCLTCVRLALDFLRRRAPANVRRLAVLRHRRAGLGQTRGRRGRPVGHPPEEGDFGLNGAGHGADWRPPAGRVEKVDLKKSGLEKKPLLESSFRMLLVA